MKSLFALTTPGFAAFVLSALLSAGEAPADAAHEASEGSYFASGPASVVSGYECRFNACIVPSVMNCAVVNLGNGPECVEWAPGEQPPF
ncbi:MAG: hypothetical protein AAF682_09235 [Planctomycetota bacterium]